MSGLLRTALRTYPRDVRRNEGDVLLALAQDMVDGGSSPLREAAGLALGGVRARFGVRRIGPAPWGAALWLLGLPLAALLLAVVIAATHWWTHGVEWVGWWLASALGGSVLALAGIALGRRRPAALGSLALLFACLAELRGNVRFPAHVEIGQETAMQGPDYWLYQPALGLCSLAALLLVACAFACGQPAAHGVRRLAWAAAGTAAALLVAALAARTTYVNGVAAVLAIAIVVALAALAVAARRGASALLAATLGLAALAPPLAIVGHNPASRTHHDALAAVIAFAPPGFLAVLILGLLLRTTPRR